MKGALRYKVTVEAVIEEEREVVSEFTTVGEEWDEKASAFKKVFGRPPAILKQVRTEQKVFEQVVDELDFAGLVSVINRIPRAA